MTNKGVLIKMIIVIIIIMLGIYTVISLPVKNEDIQLFPGIIGDTTLKSNETGIHFIKDMMSYDDFRGNVIQGYKATYSGSNGTMIIFIAQMLDYNSSIRSINEMVVRMGYNQSFNQNVENDIIVIKLPVKNPEVFVIQKDKGATWHYTFAKSNKIYWVGFSEEDLGYQESMLIELYRNIDKEKSSFDI